MYRNLEHKKVLFVATNIEYIEKYCIPLLKWLKEENYDIHIASSGKEKLQYCDKHFNLPFNKSKIKTYKFLKEIIEKNNYEFIQCYTLLGGIITRLAARKSKAKIIYTAESFPFYKGSGIKKWLIHYPLEKYLSKHTDILLTINDEDYILAKNKFRCKVKLINGLGINKDYFDINLTEEERKEYLKEFNLNKEDYILLTIGDLNENNNQILQIEAVMQIIEEYKNIKLLIVGDGPLEEFYSNIIEKYNLSENIKLIGERKDTLKLLKLCHCLLATSKTERLPLNVIKAMFANKPIIASRIRKHKELLEDDYLVNINNADELVERIEKCIIKGKRRVNYNVEKYSLDNIIAQIKNIYFYKK